MTGLIMSYDLFTGFCTEIPESKTKAIHSLKFDVILIPYSFVT